MVKDKKDTKPNLAHNEFEVVVVIPYDSNHSKRMCENRVLYVEDVESFQDTIVLHSSSFKNVFNIPKYQYFQKWYNFSRRCPVVKISYGNRTIYRRVELLSVSGFKQHYAGLTNKSLGELSQIIYDNKGNNKSDKPKKGSRITIKPGSTLLYYWQHPNSATRMSFRIGLPSLIISIVSLICSLISPIKEFVNSIIDIIIIL